MTVPTRLHGRLLYFAIGTQATPATPVDLSADTVEVTGIPGEVEMGDVTTGGSTGHRFWPGLQKQSVSVKMIYNPTTTTGAWDVLKTYQTDAAPRACVFAPGGNTSTYPKYTFNAWVKTIDAPVKVADVVTMTVTLEVDNGVTCTTV